MSEFVFDRLKPLFWVTCLLCFTVPGVEAASWHEHKRAGFSAFDDRDYAGAIEQFEAALTIAYEEQAPAQDLGAILENLATAFLAAGKPERAWEAIERWDVILAMSENEPSGPKQLAIRDKLAPLIRQTLGLAETSQNSEPGAGTSTAPSGARDFAIHLESLKSDKNVQSSWRELTAAYPSQLSDKALLVKKVDLEDQGTFFRILATSFATAEGAQKVCTELKGLGQYCVVVSVR